MYTHSGCWLFFIALIAATTNAAPWYEASLKFIRAVASIQSVEGSVATPHDVRRHEVLGFQGTAPVPVSKSTAMGATSTGIGTAPASTATTINLNVVNGTCNATYFGAQKRSPRVGGPFNRYYRRAQGTGHSLVVGTGVPFGGCAGGVVPTGSRGPTGAAVGAALSTGVAPSSGANIAGAAGATGSPIPIRRRFG